MRLLFLLFSLLPTPFLGQSLLIRQARVLDVPSGEIIGPYDLKIDQGLIMEMELSDKAQLAADDTLAANGRYLMPGLVDGHVHYFQSGGLYARPDVIDLRTVRPYEEEQAWLWEHIPDLWRRYLAGGITTTFDLGGPMKNYALKDSASQAVAPAIRLTGPLLSSYQPAEFEVEDPPIILVKSPEEGRIKVREQLPFNPDFIKIWYIVLPGQDPQGFFPIAEAICDEAHQAGVPVAVHATQLETAKKALEAGADYLVHSVNDRLVDSTFVQLMLQQQAYYCPTLTVGQSYEEVLAGRPDLRELDWHLGQAEVIRSLWTLPQLAPEDRPAWVDQLLTEPLAEDRRMPIMAANLKTLTQAGVPIIAGTDAGNIGTLHASSYAEELEAMGNAGLSPAQVLRACTSHPAAFLGQKSGQVAVGYQADLLMLDANPLQDLAAVSHPRLVFRRGQAFYPDRLIDQSSEDVVSLWASSWRMGAWKTLGEMLHPGVVMKDRGRQWVGRNRVILLLQNRQVPSGTFQLYEQAQGWLLQWGERSLFLKVKQGKISEIWL
ncbi:MAG: amidohydrolase family protein [Bacteroidota bacterium]